MTTADTVPIPPVPSERTQPIDELVYFVMEELARLQATLREVWRRMPPEITPSEGPGLRPHTMAGWWQVWQGSVCVALLRPEDVELLRANLDHEMLPRSPPPSKPSKPEKP